MTSPQFFLIGAPKCGTTSLASWLANHPHIYMPTLKEPHYFNTDMMHRLIKDEKSYLALFDRASPNNLAVGEASVWYLFSQNAISNIESFTNQNARYIICVRNPIDMAHSLHGHLCNKGYESNAAFARAWELQASRKSGTYKMSSLIEPSFFQYSDVCSLGGQLSRLYKQIPFARRHVILLDDMKSNPTAVYQSTLDFLNIPADGRTEFPTLNKARVTRSPMIQLLLNRAVMLWRKVGFKPTGSLGGIMRLISREKVNAPMPPTIRVQLQAHFQSEIQIMADLLDRDLSYWS